MGWEWRVVKNKETPLKSVIKYKGHTLNIQLVIYVLSTQHFVDDSFGDIRQPLKWSMSFQEISP